MRTIVNVGFKWGVLAALFLWSNCANAVVATGVQHLYLSSCAINDGLSAYGPAYCDAPSCPDSAPVEIMETTDYNPGHTLKVYLKFWSDQYENAHANIYSCPVGGVWANYDTDQDGLINGSDPEPYNPAPVDTDGDGIADSSDNCPAVSNVGQQDADGDGIGDACDSLTDSDSDGVADSLDNCPALANGSQVDADGDGVGDVCDSSPNGPDSDGDGRSDSSDNCPSVSNSSQSDWDGDGIGNSCDAPPTSNAGNFFGPYDSFNAPAIAGHQNGHAGPYQGELIANGVHAFCNGEQLGSYAVKAFDGEIYWYTGGDVTVCKSGCFKADPNGSCVDPDGDDDGIADEVDNCKSTYNPDQLDSDGDGIGDACDMCGTTATINAQQVGSAWKSSLPASICDGSCSYNQISASCSDNVCLADYLANGGQCVQVNIPDWSLLVEPVKIDPVAAGYDWVGDNARPMAIKNALNYGVRTDQCFYIVNCSGGNCPSVDYSKPKTPSEINTYLAQLAVGLSGASPEVKQVVVHERTEDGRVIPANSEYRFYYPNDGYDVGVEYDNFTNGTSQDSGFGTDDNLGTYRIGFQSRSASHKEYFVGGNYVRVRSVNVSPFSPALRHVISVTLRGCGFSGVSGSAGDGVVGDDTISAEQKAAVQTAIDNLPQVSETSCPLCDKVKDLFGVGADPLGFGAQNGNGTGLSGSGASGDGSVLGVMQSGGSCPGLEVELMGSVYAWGDSICQKWEEHGVRDVLSWFFWILTIAAIIHGIVTLPSND